MADLERQRSSKRMMAAVVAVVLSLIVAACSNEPEGSDTTDSGDTSSSEAEPEDNGSVPGDTTQTTTGSSDDSLDPVSGGRLVIGVETEDPSFDTFVASRTTAGRLIAAAIFDTTIAYQNDGTPAEFLATSVESNEDGTVWSVELRPGLEFHDGTPLDAEALKFHIDTVAETARERETAYEVIEGTTVTGDLSVEFTISTPWASFRDAMASERFYITSPAAVEEYGVDDELGDHPVGTGPFVFEEWERGSHLTVARNDNYWYEGPYLDEIEFRFMPDEDSRIAALRAGDIDVALFTGGASAQFIDDPDFNAHFYTDGVNGLALNMDEPPLDDIRVRRALAHALDRETVVQVVWNGLGDLNSSPLPTNNPYHVDVGVPEYDPDEAARLVEEYEAETGNEVAFSISWQSNALNLQLVQLLQAQWEAVGVEVEVPAPLQSAALIQHAFQKEHQVLPYPYPSHFDPDLWLNNGWRSGSFLNFATFENPRVDELLDLGKASTDPDVRTDAYTEIQELHAEALPWIMINDNVVGTVYADHVKGIGEWRLPNGELGHGQESRVPFMLESIWINGSE